MTKTMRLCIVFTLVLGLYLFPVSVAMADNGNGTSSEINITLFSKNFLFDVINMKPGDWAPRQITVNNSGSKDFAYHMQLRNDGEKK
ncbi:hypothetical protein P5G51_004845 [Virgibacillus sp. 179-BFC.A HS]|uniref:Uncharacterized protein n=1 Tax=Tigheibacillus jepli TaxID=3035914 RepID=A0ABU5CG12_9BACI|nr:hypothetical protein [Virgibacillus sp. 179-BFC.A HS]MDY0404817.1 hypothetical protein [Virgibacillus sp. 179-BFC.A HS]